MVKSKGTNKSQQEEYVDAALGHASIYAFVLGVLTLIWALTGFGYYWPIWFMIGWLLGPLALPFFQAMFQTFQAYSRILMERVGTHQTKPEKKKSPITKDDSDVSGA